MALVCTIAPPAAQLAMIGTLTSIVVGLVLEIIDLENARNERLSQLEALLGISLLIARDSSVFQEFEQIVENIARTTKIDNALFQELALDQIKRIGQVTSDVSRGRIEFNETETWRIAYEQVLRSLPVTHYYSVAYVASNRYWQDEPGKRSLQLNYQLQDEKGLNVERIAIIADSIWPTGQELPSDPIGQWLMDQHEQGIWIEVVRESQIVDEPDLHQDFGIYMDVAVGHQVTDSQSRTSKFVLSFNQQEMATALHRWERLKLFSKSIRQILDQSS